MEELDSINVSILALQANITEDSRSSNASQRESEKIPYVFLGDLGVKSGHLFSGPQATLQYLQSRKNGITRTLESIQQQYEELQGLSSLVFE